MRTWLLMAALAAALGGCATRESGSVYGKQEIGREQTVRFGTVDGVREVTIAGSQSGVGAIGGGALGGIAGSTVGEGRGSSAAAVVGAVAGGVAGAALEEGATRKNGLEITVRLDNGDLRAIVQAADVLFKPGERVRLLTAGGITRVTRQE
jgi:outer membrane lipoprotein SlyB